MQAIKCACDEIILSKSLLLTFSNNFLYYQKKNFIKELKNLSEFHEDYFPRIHYILFCQSVLFGLIKDIY